MGISLNFRLMQVALVNYSTLSESLLDYQLVSTDWLRKRETSPESRTGA